MPKVTRRKITMKAAWLQGSDAALKGLPLSANPFDAGKGLFNSWNDGWNMAHEPRRDDQEKRSA